MTFPFPVVEEAPQEAPSHEDSPADSEIDAIVLPRSVTPRCPACDGTGRWRGIDGFVFVCQHCVFEMT